MLFNESSQSTTEFQQHVVRVHAVPPLAPAEELFSKVCFLGNGTGLDALPENGQFFAPDSDVSDYILDTSETSQAVKGYYLFNDDEIDQALFDRCYTQGYTLVLGDFATTAYLALSNKPAFKGLLLLTVSGSSTTPLESLVKQVGIGCMIDQDKQGKALHAVTSMLKNGRSLVNTNKIVNSTFSAINNSTIADELTSLGFSYYFKSVQKTYLDSLFFGGLQAFSQYINMIIQYDIRTYLANRLNAGVTFKSADGLRLAILEALKVNDNNILRYDEIGFPNIEEVSFSDLNNGILRDVTIVFKSDSEVRRIFVEIEEQA